LSLSDIFRCLQFTTHHASHTAIPVKFQYYECFTESRRHRCTNKIEILFYTRLKKHVMDAVVARGMMQKTRSSYTEKLVSALTLSTGIFRNTGRGPAIISRLHYNVVRLPRRRSHSRRRYYHCNKRIYYIDAHPQTRPSI